MTAISRNDHPCFNKKSVGGCGRVHLPVAPKCNIQCNYCNRKYDCVNESRPGVTSGVLTPVQAVAYVDRVLEKMPKIKVIGIAGPGDSMANAVETLTTIRMIREKYPDMNFCMSSNGFALPRHLDAIAQAGLTHATVTMNAVDPVIGAKIYNWVRDDNVLYRGEQGAQMLMNRQLESIEGLVERGIAVKVNTIVIPGVNDHHLAEVSRVISGLGATIMNCLPLIPTAGTRFEEMTEPSKDMMRSIRKETGKNIEQMTHCKRCRSDAVGLLEKDRSLEMAPVLKSCSDLIIPKESARPHVAVCTREGMLINQHLGEAGRFQIWGLEDGQARLLETREAPRPGAGPRRWSKLAETLSDCRAVLAAACGETPRQVLTSAGVLPHQCSGLIEPAVMAALTGSDMGVYSSRDKSLGQACCTGTGSGCG